MRTAATGNEKNEKLTDTILSKRKKKKRDRLKVGFHFYKVEN
jgi:hypothetical protein